MIARVLLLFGSVLLVSGLNEGDGCEKNGVTGTCVNLMNCRSALDDMEKKIDPQICTFDGVKSIVCCLDKAHIDPMNTNNSGQECEPIPTSKTSPRTGQKAWDKCVEYQEKYVYPCERSIALIGGMTRANNCYHTEPNDLIIGGASAASHEFPHMAMIGFGERSKLEWLCGGSIISENFILTAGHCISNRNDGNASHVVVGVHTRSDAQTADDSKIFRIKRIVKHPNFKPPQKYNDIALLETDRPIKLDQYTVPGCLDVGNSKNDDKAIATGWGLTTDGILSETLRKVSLTKYTMEECSLIYGVSRLLREGLDSTQLCYGDRLKSTGTTQGDGGGPLQIYHREIQCMYVIVGVTSFGKGRYGTEPGIYTRVASYVPWIESVVWP